MSDNSSILVLGAGELGMSVLRHLARRFAAATGTPPAVLLRFSTIDSRDPAKRRDLAELRSLGVRFVSGDLVTGSRAELSGLFKDFDTVIGCTGFVGGPGFQLKLTRAILEAGAGRYVPWQFGVDYDLIGRGSAQELWNEQLDVRDLLRSQARTEWLIVSTGLFTSFLFEPAFGVVDLAHDTVRALGGWDNAVTVTTPDDVGAMTAEILLAQPHFANQVVFTAGDTVTYRQLADILDAVLGRSVRRLEWTVPMLRDDLARAPHDPIRKYRVAFAEGRGVSWEVGKTFNGQRRIVLTGVEQWARQNLK